MRTIFHPFLPNGPSGDPVLWVDLLDEGHSLLIDLGDLRAIPNRKLLRVDRVLVTHTHMDHFIGFDHLLRLALGRERELVITGPPGFLERVSGRIAAYTWNVISSYPVVLVAEAVEGNTIRSVVFSGAGRMQPEPRPDRPFSRTLHAHRAYTLEADLFDHDVPVLGVALTETEHLAVDKDRLLRMGLKPGPWLSELKQQVRSREPGDVEVEVETIDGGTAARRCDELAREILTRTPGQKIAYLTALGFTESNLARAVDLVRDADLLICEAAFLHEDEKLARQRNHLTARQAGELARAAGARRLAPFHFSPRYGGRHGELFEEAARFFGGPVLELPGADRSSAGEGVS
jgi:ribonuclease Z